MMQSRPARILLMKITLQCYHRTSAFPRLKGRAGIIRNRHSLPNVGIRASTRRME